MYFVNIYLLIKNKTTKRDFIKQFDIRIITHLLCPSLTLRGHSLLYFKNCELIFNSWQLTNRRFYVIIYLYRKINANRIGSHVILYGAKSSKLHGCSLL